MTSALKEAREQAGLAIEDVASKLKIRRQYLIALEEDKREEIPGEVYAQGYLKMYAGYLGIDLDEYCVLNPINDCSGFWSKPERLAQYGTYKFIISLFLMGILCIFCWYNLVDKVSSDSEIALIDRLGEFSPQEETAMPLPINHSLGDTISAPAPTQGDK